MPQTKLAQLRASWERGDRLGALRLAAKFPALGNEKVAIRRGWAAHQSPALYRQIGYQPEHLLDAAYAALQRRYCLPDPQHVDA